jgi:hypothetical protein
VPEPAELVAAFERLMAERGYPLRAAAELPLAEPPYFVNASVTPYLDAMAAGRPITRSAQVQPCFRARPLPGLPRVFTMLGVLAPGGDTVRVLADCAAFVTAALPSDTAVFAACAATDPDLVGSCHRAGLATRTSADPASTQWRYGRGNRLTGRGVALVATTPAGDRFVAGTVTVVTNPVTLTDYVEAGIGLEPLLAARHRDGLLAIAPWAPVAAVAPGSDPFQLADLVVAVSTLVAAGTGTGPRRGGYLLRRLIAELDSALPGQPETIARLFDQLPGGDRAVPVLLAELGRRAEQLVRAEQQARRWIDRSQRAGRSVTVDDVTATFGLPPAAAELVLASATGGSAE